MPSFPGLFSRGHGNPREQPRAEKRQADSQGPQRRTEETKEGPGCGAWAVLRAPVEVQEQGQRLGDVALRQGGAPGEGAGEGGESRTWH